MSRSTGRTLRGLALGAVVLCAYGAGVVTGSGTGRKPAPRRPALLDDAAERITRQAAEPVDRAALERAALDGMLRRLGDRWARYYTARVLVDAGTASAAEVVAGSLRDRDRAVLVRSRTYGMGSVQEPVRLADGSAIELTVGRYRTPGGRNLDGVGIEPDVAVSADRPSGEVLHRAQAVLRGLLAAVPTTDRG